MRPKPGTFLCAIPSEIEENGPQIKNKTGWRVSPLALEGAELVTLGEAEWLELRLEVDGLGCGEDGECLRTERWWEQHPDTAALASYH